MRPNGGGPLRPAPILVTGYLGCPSGDSESRRSCCYRAESRHRVASRLHGPDGEPPTATGKASGGLCIGVAGRVSPAGGLAAYQDLADRSQLRRVRWGRGLARNRCGARPRRGWNSLPCSTAQLAVSGDRSASLVPQHSDD